MILVFAQAQASAPVLPVYLTAKERKRIRRQAREERRNEERDKIALGLMEAPEPKLKLANFMKVSESWCFKAKVVSPSSSLQLKL